MARRKRWRETAGGKADRLAQEAQQRVRVGAIKQEPRAEVEGEVNDGRESVFCFGLCLVGGAVVRRTKRLLKVRDTGVLASCEVLCAGAKSGD